MCFFNKLANEITEEVENNTAWGSAVIKVKKAHLPLQELLHAACILWLA